MVVQEGINHILDLYKGNKEVKIMKKWQCQMVNCGYIYNPEKGDRKGKIEKGTPFEELPEDWKCPICKAGKKMFKALDEQ